MRNKMIALAGAIGFGMLVFVGAAFGIGGGVAAAEDEAFRINSGVLTAYLGTDAYVYVPDTVTVIGEGAFAGNKTLASITLPDSVNAISYNAFKGCTALTDIMLSDNVVKVGPGAFEGCSALKLADIGKNVKSWGSGVFTDCNSLAKVLVDKDNRYLTYYNGAIYNGNMTMLYQVLPARGGENYVMPETVAQIDAYAFRNLQNVKNVKLSENVASVPKYSMTSMGSVENVSLSSSVRTVSERAFSDNQKLAQVYIPSSVGVIDNNAFSGSPNVKIFTEKGSAADAFGVKKKIEVIYSAQYPVDFMDSNVGMDEMPDLNGIANNADTADAKKTLADNNKTDEGADAKNNSFEAVRGYANPLDVPENGGVIGKTVISAGRAVILMNNRSMQVYGISDEAAAKTETASDIN